MKTFTATLNRWDIVGSNGDTFSFVNGLCAVSPEKMDSFDDAVASLSPLDQGRISTLDEEALRNVTRPYVTRGIAGAGDSVKRAMDKAQFESEKNSEESAPKANTDSVQVARAPAATGVKLPGSTAK